MSEHICAITKTIVSGTKQGTFSPEVFNIIVSQNKTVHKLENMTVIYFYDFGFM